jgi:transcription antitermination factor NusG
MEQFIAVVQDAAVDKTFYAPDEVNISSGTKVRVHGGPFDGFEGVLVRVQGKRNKQFFINIDGLVAVNTVVKNVELLEVME